MSCRIKPCQYIILFLGQLSAQLHHFADSSNVLRIWGVLPERLRFIEELTCVRFDFITFLPVLGKKSNNLNRKTEKSLSVLKSCLKQQRQNQSKGSNQGFLSGAVYIL